MDKIDKIVIVGGGSSGWMTAAFLIKTFPDKQITVIESPDVPIVGVGESTLVDITNFRDYLGINEKEFMKETDASYKMSIKFTDFYKKDSGGFHYPFRFPEYDVNSIGMMEWLEIKAFYPETPVQDFVRCYFPSAALFENNKFSLNKDNEFGEWKPEEDVAYHFDAVKFGAWLKNNYCIPNGVVLEINTVVDAQVSDNGIDYLLLKDGKQVYSDLFIDCTGFKSLLLGEYLKEPFISKLDMLPNNRAWATQVPYIDKEKELEPFTNGTAIENGWCWNIPLWSRLGSGYVYSDKYVSPEDAKEQFKNYLMSDKMIVPRTREQVDSLEFRDIQMRVGIHERLWVKNVVGIGLSSGFIEPLESNGLFSVTAFLYKLAKSLLREGVTQFDRDVYNTTCRILFKNFSEFVALHYTLSIRTDTPYWKAINEKVFCPEMPRLEPVSSAGFSDVQNRKMFTNEIAPTWGITYISVGMNYSFFDRVNQRCNTFGKDIKPYIDNLVLKYGIRKNVWNEAAKTKPTLYQYLKENIHND
jgi:tryptophan halogenase